MRSPFPLRALALALLLSPMTLTAHCDTWDGPVVKAGREALASGDVNLALIWVRKADESEVRAAFRRALAVRKLEGEAQELADQFFFETLVRIHRAGEGASYTGLKSADEDLGPAIPTGDRAIATGNLQPVWDLLSHSVRQTLQAKFEDVQKAKAYKPGDLEAGRAFVATYVSYIHFVEGVYGTATRAGHDEAAAAPATGAHEH